MPSDIKEGDYEYRDMMDQLNEVIQKYEETYDILLCGVEEYGIITSTKHLKRLEKHTGFGKIREIRTVALKGRKSMLHYIETTDEGIASLRSLL